MHKKFAVAIMFAIMYAIMYAIKVCYNVAVVSVSKYVQQLHIKMKCQGIVKCLTS